MLRNSILLLVLFSTPSWAFTPRPSAELATCTRSVTLLACADALGNGYSVATVGNTTYLKGFEVQDKRSWAQTNIRVGQLTFFTGVASNGETWIGSIQRVGWTTLTRVSSSNGTRSSISCGRLTGCQPLTR